MLNLIEKNLYLVQNKILEYSNSSLPILNKIITYSIKDAKYNRAKLFFLLIGLKNFSNVNDKDQIIILCFQDIFIKFSSAIEIIHTATLLHDDVIDEAITRRYKKTTHIQFTNKKSILTGDFLLAKALSIISEYQSSKILGIVCDSMSKIITGEIMQAQYNSLELELDEYYEIIKSKTAELFKMTAICAYELEFNNSHKFNIKNKLFDIELFKFIGTEIGIIFQLVDDILDYFGNANNIGKDIFNDFFTQKFTLPLILLAKEKEANLYIKQIFSNKEDNIYNKNEIIKNILFFMNKYSIKQKIQLELENKFNSFQYKLFTYNNVNNIYITSIIDLYKSIIKKIH
ncbi:MAG: polyprenyl synthetase family protein [Rickettsiales bacterium]